ncbi:MAG: YeeE/YedE family protein [Verrucomicrobia bacterium]|nr:MAG: YeeE/YedE family protein [Verrucomicrobiota bacterium]
MNHYTLWHALIGGILIGLASLLATVLSGKIPGISGVFSFALWQSAALFRPMRPLVVMAIAGLLVGFGTRLGGGCTSGHGVCGVGMGAKDSIAATLIFIVTAMMIVFIYNRVVL